MTAKSQPLNEAAAQKEKRSATWSLSYGEVVFRIMIYEPESKFINWEINPNLVGT